MYENQTFEAIMERMLERVPDEMDRREGSVIYDALAPAAIELEQAYLELDNTLANTFATTCSREFLIQYAAERGIEPIPATPAVVKIVSSPSYVDIPIDSVLTIGLLNYTVTAKIANGQYEATCNTPGTEGNNISDDMTVIPVLEITGLESIEFDSVLDEGVDEEDTESLRSRYLETLKPYAFGGNVADYKAKTLSIYGVGAVRVFSSGDVIGNLPLPGGYLALAILDNNLDVASQSLIDKVQNTIDPDLGKGYGLAPIGHAVHVFTPTETGITISLEVSLNENISSAHLETLIRDLLEDYLKELRKEWAGSSEGIFVRRSKVEELVFTLEPIIDCRVTELKITGESSGSHNLLIDPIKVPVLDVLNVIPSN